MTSGTTGSWSRGHEWRVTAQNRAGCTRCSAHLAAEPAPDPQRRPRPVRARGERPIGPCGGAGAVAGGVAGPGRPALSQPRRMPVLRETPRGFEAVARPTQRAQLTPNRVGLRATSHARGSSLGGALSSRPRPNAVGGEWAWSTPPRYERRSRTIVWLDASAWPRSALATAGCGDRRALWYPRKHGTPYAAALTPKAQETAVVPARIVGSTNVAFARFPPPRVALFRAW
jgi:hypothetical protein